MHLYESVHTRILHPPVALQFWCRVSLYLKYHWLGGRTYPSTQRGVFRLVAIPTTSKNPHLLLLIHSHWPTGDLPATSPLFSASPTTTQTACDLPHYRRLFLFPTLFPSLLCLGEKDKTTTPIPHISVYFLAFLTLLHSLPHRPFPSLAPSLPCEGRKQGPTQVTAKGDCSIDRPQAPTSVHPQAKPSHLAKSTQYPYVAIILL